MNPLMDLEMKLMEWQIANFLKKMAFTVTLVKSLNILKELDKHLEEEATFIQWKFRLDQSPLKHILDTVHYQMIFGEIGKFGKATKHLTY